MTHKQEVRVKYKLKKILADIAAEQKVSGDVYLDLFELRYDPPRFYIQIGDFSGGLSYVNWFDQTFPDDIGFPDFLFEWTVILFKTGRKKEAEKKAFQTFIGNTYIIDKFFGRPITPIDMWEGSNLEDTAYADNYFKYSHKQKNLLDFSAWLDQVTQTEKFKNFTGQYIEILKQLKYENNFEKRSKLVESIEKLELLKF